MSTDSLYLAIWLCSALWYLAYGELARAINQLQDLEGRVVGRNNDDAAFLCNGLEVLLQDWEAMESRVQDSNQLMEQVRILCSPYS